MGNPHSNNNYSKYFIYNDSGLILFHCDFTYNLHNDKIGGRHFSVLNDVTINVNCL